MWLLHWLMGANHAFGYRGDIVGFALVFLVSPVGVFLHEAGHALPALLLTRGNVDMHVGAKGPGMHLRAGRFRMTLHAWPDGEEDRAGWVRHQPTRVIWMLVITSGGPLFSCLGAVAGGTLAQRFALGSPPSLLFAALWFACSAHTVISLTG